LRDALFLESIHVVTRVDMHTWVH